MSYPDFIDNRDGNTLAQALREVLSPSTPAGSSDAASTSPDVIQIVTAFFSPSGFAHIVDELQLARTVQLLLCIDLAGDAQAVRRNLDETEEHFTHRRVHSRLQGMTSALRAERDHLPFSLSSRGAMEKLVRALRAGNIEVRRYEKTFLHAKAYIFTHSSPEEDPDNGIIVGSSNLTAAGLNSNLELNLGRYEHPIVGKARKWFSELWEEAEPYDLALIFEEAFKPRSPWEIFLRVLWQLYGSEVEEDAKTDENLPLTSFQKHGVTRAMRLIRDVGGVIVADEVGLGKTFIAGEIMQVYREQRQRSLLICPASLRDTTWKKFLSRFQLFVECLSFEELASDIQLSDPRHPNAQHQKLDRSLDEYQLVVVDEAHNYRNPNAPTRAATLRRLLFGQPRDLLLLTATPVNNSLWDLYHLIRYFVRQDAHFADRGIRSIRERFTRAMRLDPSNLTPELLYPIIDATTVKRTRQFVKQHYANDTIIGSDGQPAKIVFPKPIALSVDYNLDNLMSGLFDKVESALDPDGDSQITFVRYTPEKFLYDKMDEEEEGRLGAMVGLLRSSLLKRFESSVCAFRGTVSKMVSQHDIFLKALDSGTVVSTSFLQEVSADDEDAVDEILSSIANRDDHLKFDVGKLRDAVERDRAILMSLLDATEEIGPAHDPKLQALLKELREIASQANHEALDNEDEAQKRKVLVFSYFEDTVKWIQAYLDAALPKCEILKVYHKRMVAVSGSDDLHEVKRQQAVKGFAPISMEAPPGQDSDLYDLLITTDVLAEGVNLQQCRHIINYDMPWNPMRLVQRHGRIDRIGSPHKRVYLRTIFPFDKLEPMLRLKERIVNKLAMAAVSIGVAAPIEGAHSGDQVFTETKTEIEKLLREDASLYERGGTAGSAQTGEEYRQTLRKALSVNRDSIVNLPWKVGSGMLKGTQQGFFFCAVVGERTYLRFVSATRNWRIEDTEGAIIREIGTCLRLIECSPDTPAKCPPMIQDLVYDFWEVAQQDIHADWTRETDPAYLQPQLRAINRLVAEFIRANTPLDMASDKVTRALDILESPWSRREEAMLRVKFAEEEHHGATRSRNLVEMILETGLEPAVPPPPLPPIELHDIELLCWMAIECDP